MPELRYTVESARGREVYRVSKDLATFVCEGLTICGDRYRVIEHAPPRFAIRKLKPIEGRPLPEYPWILYDRTLPAFRFHARTHKRAVHAMRNIVRREAGLGPLLEWPGAGE